MHKSAQIRAALSNYRDVTRPPFAACQSSIAPAKEEAKKGRSGHGSLATSHDIAEAGAIEKGFGKHLCAGAYLPALHLDIAFLSADSIWIPL
jgi:hypothetical protein